MQHQLAPLIRLPAVRPLGDRDHRRPRQAVGQIGDPQREEEDIALPKPEAQNREINAETDQPPNASHTDPGHPRVPHIAHHREAQRNGEKDQELGPREPGHLCVVKAGLGEREIGGQRHAGGGRGKPGEASPMLTRGLDVVTGQPQGRAHHEPV